MSVMAALQERSGSTAKWTMPSSHWYGPTSPNGLPSRKGLQCVMSSVITGTSALLCVMLQQESVDEFLRNVNTPRPVSLAWASPGTAGLDFLEVRHKPL